VKQLGVEQHLTFVTVFALRDVSMVNRVKRIVVAIAIIALAVISASAQDFGFTGSNGQTVTLSSLRGRVIVLMFSGPQDPQCRDGFKALETLAERVQGKDVGIYWVNVGPTGDPCGAAKSVVVLRDTSQAAFKRLSGKSGQLPTIVILDRQGNPVGRPRGGFNPNSDFVNDLASVIDTALQNK
jgi:thiol-disulfide isomerase/thioredoxin